jgi:hypothetical protein
MQRPSQSQCQEKSSLQNPCSQPNAPLHQYTTFSYIESTLESHVCDHFTVPWPISGLINSIAIAVRKKIPVIIMVKATRAADMVAMLVLAFFSYAVSPVMLMCWFDFIHCGALVGTVSSRLLLAYGRSAWGLGYVVRTTQHCQLLISTILFLVIESLK